MKGGCKMAQNLPKNPKKSTIKARITAALVAVLALVPVLLLCVGAVTPFHLLPHTGTFDQPDATAAEQWKGLEEHNVAYQSVGESEDFTFSWGSGEFLANVAWSYACVQMTIYDVNNVPHGHFSIGLYRTNGSALFVRLSKYIEVNGEWDIEYPYNEEITAPINALAGFSINKLTDGSATVSLQYFDFADNLMTIRETGNAVFTLPEFVDHVTFEAKTNNAAQRGYVWDTTIDTPHTPLDLYEQANAYNAGENDLRDTGEVVSSTIWQIISMPFDILASVLNFDIFGINVWAVATTLLTIGLIFWVLKKVGVF